MRFKVQSTATYRIRRRSTAILNVHAQRTSSQRILEESLELDPAVECEELRGDDHENRLIRIDTGGADELAVRYEAVVETNPVRVPVDGIGSIPIAQLDRDVIPYLFPSRYCQSDRLGRLAEGKFGDIGTPLAQARAISDWVFENVEYLPGTTDSGTSAFDTVTQRAGVCRDFAHLGIALCRALSIPARYFSGYSYRLDPPDFHACFEVYAGGRWFIFDPTRLAPLNGLVRIGTGRDAADASIATIFGNMSGTSVEVGCEYCGGDFDPWSAGENEWATALDDAPDPS